MLQRTCSLVVALLVLLFTTVAHAGYDGKDSPPDLFCEQGKTAGSNPAFGGKPVSLFSGMETFAPSTDLTLGSLYPIRITRSYNSKTTYDSPLGYGWAINYDKRLYTYADNSATVRRECGKKYRFAWYSPSGFTSLSTDAGILVQNTDGTYSYTDIYGEKEHYDSQGRLVSMVDTKGNALVFSYTAATRDFLFGLLPYNLDQSTSLIVAYDYHLSKIEEKDASGNLTGVRVDFHYDSGTGRLVDMTDSTGRTVSYDHDIIGNLISVAGLVGSSAYGYSNAGNYHLLTSIDEGSGVYVNTYTAGKVTRQTHGMGIIDFEYLIPYQKTRMTTYIKDSSGSLLNTQTKTVEFDTNGVPVKVTDTFGNITTYVRESTTRIREEGHADIVTGITTTTAYTYDSNGNTLTKTEAVGTSLEKMASYTYDPAYSKVQTTTILSVVNPALYSVTTNSYDPANGNLLTTTETGFSGDGTPYMYTTTYGYDGAGHVTSIDGPRTDVTDLTSYVYDPTTGFLTSTTQPIIGTTTYSNHDALGNPQTVTDPNGNSTTYTYDTNGRVSTVKAPGDTNATQYFYVSGCSSCGGANKIDYILMPLGHKIDYEYDDLSNLITIIDNAGNTINYTYDSEGNRLGEETRNINGVLINTQGYLYDALNRLAQIKNFDASYTAYGYDGRGNRISVKQPNDADNVVTRYEYDALNRLTAVVQPGDVSTSYGYNSNSNLTSVTDDNGHATTYIYDDKGRVYQIVSPDTGTTTYSYDPAGNLISKTDAKEVTTTYSYDALNRLTNIDYPADTDIIYSYDTCWNGKGRLCSMTDASGTTTYEYLPKGKVKKETKTVDSVTHVTQYTYDQNGNLKTMIYPSGRVITYINGTVDRVQRVTNNGVDLAKGIWYRPFGGMTSIVFDSGLQTIIGYNTGSRIISMTTSTASIGTVLSLSYTGYDNNGNITAITDSLDASKNKSFTYDNLDRLGTATSTGIWGSLAWTYDGVGNRQTENSSAYTYYQNSNKLNTANGMSFGYDNNGNTTTEAARQYIYNQNQRLIQVNDGSMTANYTYNGNGQRVKKVVNGTTTIFHYSLNGQIIAESNGAGTISAEYVYFNGQPLAKMEGANTYYYHNDHLATPQKMTDSTGTVVWAADYKPFGEATVTISTITNNLRFPGQYYDAETGLNYNYRRDYNSLTGRYVEADPLGVEGGNNHLYLYADANPNLNYDIDGLCPSTWTQGGFGHTSSSSDLRSYQQESYSLTGYIYYASDSCDCKTKTQQCKYEVWKSSKKRTGSRRSGSPVIAWRPWQERPAYFYGYLDGTWDCITHTLSGAIQQYSMYPGDNGSSYNGTY